MLANSDYNLFIDQISNACSANPGLIAITKCGVPGLKGTIVLFDEHHRFIDSYTIEILATPDFPKYFPLVFETGERIPKNYDWHVYETDGHCCIKTTPEEMLACKKGITLTSFIETEVKPYFFNQTFRRINGYFYQERSHGLMGWLEYFKEVFRTEDFKLIGKGLTFVSKNERPNRSAPCFCGSGIKYRKCHREAYETLSTLSVTEQKIILECLGL